MESLLELKRDYEPTNILNINETGYFFQALFKERVKQEGGTITFFDNAAGD